MSTPSRHRDLALLVLRLVVGFVFFFHGSQKLFGWFGGYGLEATGQWMSSIGIPFGTFSALLAGLAEFGGGLALLTGAGVRLAPSRPPVLRSSPRWNSCPACSDTRPGKRSGIVPGSALGADAARRDCL